jgi:glucokinase
VCIITNLNWHISGSDLSTQLRIPHVSLVNDFVAAGYGCLALPPSHLTPLYTPAAKHPAPPSHAVKAIIGAGTGLGEAFAVWDEGVNGYKVYPTEGGHADFAPRTEEECEVMLAIRKRLKIDHVSVERLVSGSGIPNIYHGLRSLNPQLANKDIDAQLATPSVDAAAIISTHASTDALCRRTIQLFTTLYGAETGNLVLNKLSLGGVYIAGGVAGKMLGAMRAGEFQKAFVAKGRLGAVVETVPVWLARGEVGLDGARVVAKRLITEHKKSHKGIALLKSKL